MSKLKPAKNTKKPLKRYRDSAFLDDLGAHIKRLRIKKGYSIDRIYLEGEGLNRSSISRIERGLIDPQICTLKRIAETIGVSLHELITVHKT